jgi:hypothetical protein
MVAAEGAAREVVDSCGLLPPPMLSIGTVNARP